MKKSYVLLLLIPCLFYSCYKADQIGQYPTDKTPPGEVKSPEVKNIPGGAIITYVIPDDEDLLYVKALYKLDNGQQMEQKASAYTNSLTIEGIGRSRDVEVTLIAGDRSKNESKPVKVIAHPFDSPIYAILQSIKTHDDFGGIRLDWDNPTQDAVVISVLTNNAAGEFTNTQNFYTETKTGNGNVRGYSNEQREFGWTVRDRWGNTTDTVRSSFLPYFEQEITGAFARWNPPGIPYNAYSSSFSIEKIWDGDISTRYLVTTPGYPFSLTFDMGKLVKLSRLKQWQNDGDGAYLFTSQNVKKFQIWGSATPNVTDDFSTWTKIGEFESTKPSGSPFGQVTADDISYARAGEDYIVDLNAPPVRYIRYVIESTWSGDVHSTIAELKIFGEIQ